MSPPRPARRSFIISSSRRATLAALALLTAGLLGADRAQDPPGTEAQDPLLDGRYVQVEKVELVLVPTTVVDSKNRPVAGLKQKDFQLREQGRPIPIEFFATEADAPVAIAFVLDVSGSMRQEGKLDLAKSAIDGFVDALDAKDRFGLIAFADAQVTWITEFTSDREVFKRRVDVQHALGQTALFDALAASPQLADDAIQARKAIVLFSDGLDNASQLDADHAVDIARHASVPIYAISFIPAPVDLLAKEKVDALHILERFSRETGGNAFTVLKPPDLVEAMQRIQADLRHQYVIGFKPSPGPDATYRRISLETKRSGLRIRCRTGYQPD